MTSLFGCGYQQILAQHKGVDTRRIIAGHRLDEEIAVSFVKGQSPGIVHCGLEKHRTAPGLAEALFGGFQQHRSQSAPPGFFEHIDRNDVAVLSRSGFGNDKSDRLAPWRIRPIVKRRSLLPDQGKRAQPPHVRQKLEFRIRDSRRKAFLVDLPKSPEIAALKLADLKSRLRGLAGVHRCSPQAFYRVVVTRFACSLTRITRPATRPPTTEFGRRKLARLGP